MADQAFGLRPVKRHECAIEECVIPASDSTATFVGDAVKLAGAEDTTDNAATVIQAAAGDVIYGVVVGFAADPDSLTNQHRLADTKRRALVALAYPTTEWEIQADGAVTAGDTGQYVDLIVGAGDTVFGRSGMEADISTTAAATGQLQIMRPSRTVNEAFDTAAAGTNLIVTINESVFKTYGATAIAGEA